MRSFFLTLILILISSCSTMSKDDCLFMNWYEKGKLDGLKGEPSSTFSQYHSSCLEHGIVPEQAKYEEGRNQGLQSFCTYSSGHEIGRQGIFYQGVCPRLLEEEFMKGYQIGGQEYRLQQREEALMEKERRLNQQQQELQLQQRSHHHSHHSSDIKECHFNSDCDVEIKCSFGKCRNSDMQCTFNSDCKIKGRCSFGSCRY